MNNSEIMSLLTTLIDEHFKKQEDTLRDFKWIAQVPQTGKEYTKNKNVYELQDKAIERLKQEKTDCSNFLKTAYKRISTY